MVGLPYLSLAAERPLPSKRVLILYSHRMAFPINQQWDNGIRTALRANLREPVIIDVEYIDSYRLVGAEVQEKWFELLRLKYRDAQPDLVIPVFDAAAKQYLLHGPQAFSEADIVVCSVNELSLPHLNIAAGITGVHYRIDYRGTVDLARQLLPDLKKLIVVCGADNEVQTLLNECQSAVDSYPGLEIDYWIGLPVDQLFSQAQQAAADSAILYLSQDRDRDGRSTITPHEVAQRLSEYSSVPVFGLYDTLLGSGILGGVMVRVEDQGLRAGWIASEILNGKSASEFLFSGTNSNRATVDWRQLKRWGIAEHRLPEGTLVLLREATFWQKYSTYLASGLVIFGLQSVLIGGLLINRKYRVRAESELASQLHFKTFHSEITSRFIHLHFEHLAKVLEQTLRDVARDFGFDTAAIFQWKNGKLHLQVSAAGWTNPGIGSEAAIDLACVSKIWSRLEGGESLVVNCPSLSTESPEEMEWCRLVGVSACIVLPIQGQGSRVGVVVFGRRQGNLDLDSEQCQRLKLLSEDIANVMTRVHAEEHLRASRRTEQQLTAKLLTAQEDERRRLAREMHDDITQRLAVAAIDCGQLQKQAELSEQTNKLVSDLLQSLIQLSTDVHQLSRRLHPSILDDLGLRDAILHECNSVRTQCKISLTLRCGTLPNALSKDIQLCLYRIVQESLRNIVKHSQASRAEIVISADAEWAYLQASDNGRGMPSTRDRSAPGLGLVAMEERVHLVGGEMSITSDENTGTCINVRLPSNLDASLPPLDAGTADATQASPPGAVAAPGIFLPKDDP
jgi:signal transduction histidine kinase